MTMEAQIVGKHTRYIIRDSNGRIIAASQLVQSLLQHWKARKWVEKFIKEAS